MYHISLTSSVFHLISVSYIRGHTSTVTAAAAVEF